MLESKPIRAAQAPRVTLTQSWYYGFPKDMTEETANHAQIEASGNSDYRSCLMNAEFLEDKTGTVTDL
jgi:hypothetical protein